METAEADLDRMLLGDLAIRPEYSREVVNFWGATTSTFAISKITGSLKRTVRAYGLLEDTKAYVPCVPQIFFN